MAPRPTSHRWALASLIAACCWVAGPAGAAPPRIPMAAGTTFVIAVSNAGPAAPAVAGQHIAQGDYETVVTLTGVDGGGVRQTAFIDAFDEKGAPLQVTVVRRVRGEDLAGARLQVLGFHSSDPEVLAGSTALGPSLAVMRELLTTGSAAYSFRNFASRAVASGTLTRVPGKVSFPVLANGERVLLDAVVARGVMSVGAASRPFEQVILDDPLHPVSLRIAYGPRDGGFPFEPDFAREIVRIDFAAAEPPALAATLSRSCRVVVPGLYFDFDRATLQPQSAPALRAMAAAIRAQSALPVTVEGHTDSIGGERYNDDLSQRRAASVKAALERGHGLAASSLRVQGLGARRPLETNATLAGRARNRRVELSLACAGAGVRP